MTSYTSRTEYYEAMKKLAGEKRMRYELATEKIGLQKMRDIYKAEGITIDLRKTSAKVRAVYMCDGGDPSVLVNRNLPEVPRLFAMAHELKHHFCDQAALKNGTLQCGNYNANEVIEKAAEVFAAEFIFPEKQFLDLTESMELERGGVLAEEIVELKRTCGVPVSYTFLRKRLEWFNFIEKGEFAKVKFQKLEEQIYGVPIYRQAWFKARRNRKA